MLDNPERVVVADFKIPNLLWMLEILITLKPQSER